MANVLIEFLSSLSTTQVLVTSVIVLAFILYWYATSYHGVWEKLGVPGPKPLPFIDHTLELRQGLEPAYNKWFAQYGKTFGLYGLHPHKATLVTKDLALVKEVMVKDFDNFINSYRPEETTSSLSKGLSSAGEHIWRRHRQVTTPMFTGAKMKLMMQHINKSAQNLTQLVKECVDKGEVVPVKLVSRKFATEVIARIGFGIQTHAVSKEESEFEHFAGKYVKIGKSRFWKAVNAVQHFFPMIVPVVRVFTTGVDFINFDSDNYFINILKATMSARKCEIKKSGEEGRKTRDILDLLMKASVSDDDPRLRDSGSKIISEDEVVSNSTMLILAGGETVSAALQGILYSLAIHTEVLDKVIDEIDQVDALTGEVQYEQLGKLKYTEQVINEGLRLFPLLSYIMRIAAETKTYNGVTIPKGAVVQIPTGHIMVDPEYWPDPLKFDPDRFSPENKAGRDPISFLPFGYGPRVCLGERLAIMELKTILVYLFREFKFGLSERTYPKLGEEIKTELINGFVTLPVKPVLVEAFKRD
ncbi:unnamed protein product [Lymnaea stagnalis]|uniref:Cytochrome P450 n=1 Tax=Lymnaea stagnalis TaxID=6523 RepID=A0AAV2I865_LYMST